MAERFTNGSFERSIHPSACIASANISGSKSRFFAGKSARNALLEYTQQSPQEPQLHALCEGALPDVREAERSEGEDVPGLLHSV
jgi:hypothetical protein